MSILGITRFILMPYICWRSKRRSKRDCTYTTEELEAFAALLKSNRKSKP
jgi:hypothetical protein